MLLSAAWRERRPHSKDMMQSLSGGGDDSKGKPTGKKFAALLVLIQVLQVGLLFIIALMLPKVISGLSKTPATFAAPATPAATVLLEAQKSTVADVCQLYQFTCQHECNCTKQQSPPPARYPPTTVASRAFFPPVFDTCDLKVLGGRAADGYGSWPLCLNQVPPNSTIYSFGIGGDVSFDTTMIRRGHRVYGFDPTVKPKDVEALFKPNNVDLLKGFSFMQVGLGSTNGVVHFMRPAKAGAASMTALTGSDLKGNLFTGEGFLAPVLTLSTVMAALKHDHIDLLKVDVEGVEFDICDTDEFLEALEKVGHLIYEFHERFLKKFWGRKPKCINRLKSKGFTLVKWTKTGEYVFARMKKGGGQIA